MPDTTDPHDAYARGVTDGWADAARAAGMPHLNPRRPSGGRTLVEPGDPLVAAISAAAEAVRAGLHDRTKPEQPSDVAARVGAFLDLLHKVESMADRLTRDAAALNPTELYADDGEAPAEYVSTARGDLAIARNRVNKAAFPVQDAHNALSHLGRRE